MWESACGQAIGNLVPVAAQCCPGILHKCDYVRNLSKNFGKLGEEEKRLCEIEEDVENEKQRNPTMEMTNQCSGWLAEVQKMKREIQVLRDRYNTTRRRLCGFYPFCSLLKLGKDIVTMTGEVKLKREEEKEITRMAPRPPVSVIKKHPMKIEDKPSLDEHVKRLIMYLKSDTLKTIGVLGLPGMGKTMVMEHLNDRVGELFEIVFFVTLPVDPVPEKEIVEGIQKEIVEQLNQEVPGHLSSPIKAGIISEKLADMKYVLLLDQVSSKINLKEVLKKVGIHVDNHNHGRVVFACRDRSFWELTDEEIEIKGLSEVDAKNLFREKGGDKIDQLTYKSTGEGLLRWCSGVPLLIKLIAGRLKDADCATWRDVLTRMQTPSKKTLQEMEEFYKAVELIYGSLHEDRQPCLLHWAIFPPDSELYQEYLIECWIGERLIAENAQTLGRARDEGHGIVREFVSKYLVERGRKAGHFKMPLFLQHMALKLAYNRENLKFLVAKGGKVKQPSEEEWKDVKRVSLIGQTSFTLPAQPACSEISTLLLQKNPSLTDIPNFFFKFMPQLCVLDLYDTKIESLPKSISSLINLRVLYLNSCVQLKELPSKLKLQSLEILDLRGTGILSLPTVLAQMTGLKCLRVSFKEQNFGCTNHMNGPRPDMIPSGVIKKLSSLQELSIDIDFKNQIWDQIVYRVAEEVATLKELTSLCFYFPTLACFRTFIQKCMLERRGGDCLESFRIQVGNHKAENFLQFDFFGYTDERHLRISGGEVFSVELSKLFNLVTNLEFIGHDSENLSIFRAEDLNLVEACTIKECNAMESIIDGTITTGVAFEFLRELQLINLPKLVSICKGSIDPTSLNRLKTLTLKSCPNLKSLFPEDLIRPLCCLQDLKVEDCSELKELIEVGSLVQTVAFSKLENMELSNLPRLVSICKGLIDSTSLNSLTTLTLKSCPKLNCLFPEYMIQPLCNLQDLKVEDCSELKTLIEVGGIVQTGAFSKLKNMELVNLPELFRVCEDNSFEWLSFEIMKLKTCPKLKELPFGNGKASSLRKIECTSQWWSDLCTSQWWHNLNDSVKVRLEGLV